MASDFTPDPSQPASDPGFVPDPGQPSATTSFTQMFADASNMAQTAAETRKFVDAAKAGTFRVAPEAVADFRKSIQAMRDDLLNQRLDQNQLGQPLPLGSHPYGQQVSDHDVKSATDSIGGVITVMTNLREILISLDEALGIASGAYTVSETEKADALKRLEEN